MKLCSIVIAAALATLTAACASPASEGDEFAAEDIDDGEDGKADGPSGTYTYFTAFGDQRRCAWPYCGGYWVDRANRSTTRCVNGDDAENCYVAELDLSALELDAATEDEIRGAAFRNGMTGSKLMLRGRIKAKDFGEELGELGVFVATEAWIGQMDGEPEGSLARIESTNIQCITTPCGNLIERKLNSSAKATLSGLDWTALGDNDTTIEFAISELQMDRQIIVQGDRGWEQGPAGRGKTRSVTQLWFQARAKAPVAGECIVSGCSGEICADESMVSPCIFRPEYECYATATCGRLADGTCGWAGEGLAECLASFEN